MMTHWLLAVGFAGMAVAIFFLGWSARIMRVEWRDDRALRAAEARYERHHHRKGGPQETTLLQLPRSGRIPLERLAGPEPFPGEVELARALWPSESPNAHWRFKGEQDPGWAAEAAEYERPHQPEHVPGVDTPSDFTRRMALDMDMFIKNMVEQSNYDQHMMRAD